MASIKFIKLLFTFNPLLLVGSVSRYSRVPIAVFDHHTSCLASSTSKYPRKGDVGDLYLEPFKAHYALEPNRVNDLVMANDPLTEYLGELKQYIDEAWKGSSCHEKIQNFLNENLRDIKAVTHRKVPKDVTEIGDNPLLNFRMLNRMVSALLSEIVKTCKGKTSRLTINVFDGVKTTLARNFVALPTFKDLEDAAAGIIRMQYIYGLQSKDLSRGILNGVHTRTTFSFSDCLVLVKAALRMFEGEVLAYQWLVEASRIQAEEDELAAFIQPSDLVEYEKLLQELQNFTNVKSLEEIHDERFGKRQEKLKGLDNFDFYSTCRGETKMSLNTQAKRFCYYEQFWDPYFAINPAKIEILSLHPVILQIYDFVNNKAITEMEELSNDQLKRFSVLDKNDVKMDAGMSSWISAEASPTLITLNKRIRNLVGLELDTSESDLQVSLYSSLSYYAFQNESNLEAASVLMFLSDVQMGGYISFPEVGIFAEPLKGSALLWYPTMQNGQNSGLTLHGGCPVIMGSQTIARQQLEHEELFTNVQIHSLDT